MIPLSGLHVAESDHGFDRFFDAHRDRLLLDVAVGMQGTTLENDVVDPTGRPAPAIVFGNWGGELEERLYVEPETHELLASTTSTSEGALVEISLVQHAGVVDSTETAPDADGGSVPLTLLSTEDLVAMLGGDG